MRLTWRLEMASTRFSLMAVCPISSEVHVVMGRPWSSGFSHARAMIWERWLMLNLQGAPLRGRSSNHALRCRFFWGDSLSQRTIQLETVEGTQSTKPAIWRTEDPLWARRIRRALMTILAGKERDLVRCFNPFWTLLVRDSFRAFKHKLQHAVLEIP